jgi:hypothetical protein
LGWVLRPTTCRGERVLGLGCDRGESTHIVIGTTGLTIVVVGLVLGWGVGVAVVDIVVRWVDVC